MSEKSLRLTRIVHNVLLAAYVILTYWWWLRCDWSFGKSPPNVDAPLLSAALFGVLMLTIWAPLLGYRSLNRWLASLALWPAMILIIFFLLPAKLGINPLGLPHIITIPLVIGSMLAGHSIRRRSGLSGLCPP